MKKSWQARFKQSPSGSEAIARETAVFVESLSFDRRLYKYDIAGSIVHAEMLTKVGLLKQKEYRQIRSALLEISDEIGSGTFVFDPALEDIHMVIEDALIGRLGDLGKKLHTGRSRNDQVVLDLRLWMRDRIDHLLKLIAQLQTALVKLAEKWGKSALPGYTHLQRAQPVCLGGWLLAYVNMLARDADRLADARKRVNVCPLGAGALAGSTLPLDRRFVAEKLGFAGLAENCVDAVSDRDFCVEFVFDAATIAMHLSRWAEEWINWSSREFGFLQIADAFCTSSSMMPQKRNPDMLELIRGRCGTVYGQLMNLLTMLKGQPLAYNRDLQEDKPAVFAATDCVEKCLSMAAAIVKGTRFVPEAFAEALAEGFLEATALAEYLVQKDVPFRRAHQIVGALVAQCEDKGVKRLDALAIEDLQKACPEIERDVYEILDSQRLVQAYATEGAAGQKQLAEQIARWQKQLGLE